MCMNSIVEFDFFYTLFNGNDGNTENAPVPDLHGCPNINLLEGDSISSFFPVQDEKNNKTLISLLTFKKRLKIY